MKFHFFGLALWKLCHPFVWVCGEYVQIFKSLVESSFRICLKNQTKVSSRQNLYKIRSLFPVYFKVWTSPNFEARAGVDNVGRYPVPMGTRVPLPPTPELEFIFEAWWRLIENYCSHFFCGLKAKFKFIYAHNIRKVRFLRATRRWNKSGTNFSIP